ncbi:MULTISPECIES: alpha/beta fold hydrolase [Pseudomonas aeruginosa group]|uniref:alpha/beta fold hydrolase n=1 Tax=Pseudomonas aeruginosa group TaxID=136841 RepID=UPI001F339224|nr:MULTISPECIES: alpha/beta fold hydrolase [Pseudomonas aeruginosa group]MCP1647495.1 pimeloyl-ACP methyl ester carboxylesterase [Pseudomonas nitroreducens]MCP1686071.1 pimeloyl-ACP methyl ester carboxylesterase [Pseudomonas nitroreducens]
MPFFDHAGHRLHYEESGFGTPVLLVHGLGSSTRDWEYQVPELEKRHRVIALDVRGHGQSDKPRQRYSIGAFAEDVIALLDHLSLGRVHLVGISMGGMIGFELATRWPERLDSLTIVNSAPEVKPRSLREYLEVARRLFLAHVLGLDTVGKALGRMLFPKPEQSALRHKIQQRWPQNDKRAYLSSLHAIIGWGVQERLARITCPTLVISADRDYTPVSLKQAYVGRMPNARLVVIEDSRHATPLDQPERFNTTLLDFLEQVDHP